MEAFGRLIAELHTSNTKNISQFIMQIFASQVHFWDNEQDELELMHINKMYPPRFTLEVHGGNATHDAIALVEFKGACMDLSTEIYLRLPATGTLHFF